MMFSKTSFLVLVFSFSCLVSSAQFDFTKDETANAYQTIQQLKNKVLVVRLKTKQRQIQAYREAGKTSVAKKIENKALIENLRIISACIKFFNFSKIYFVNTEHVEYFQQSNRLILSNLLPLTDSVISISHDSVYYLDYGYLYGRQRVNEWTYKDYDNSIENSQTISENAFVIRNSKNEQLALPLPFYSVAIGSGKQSQRSASLLKPYLQSNSADSDSLIKVNSRKINFIDKSIIQLNDHLIGFYNKATKQELFSLEYWYKNNPNAELYPKWIEVQRKIQSLQEANPQFVQQGQ